MNSLLTRLVTSPDLEQWQHGERSGPQPGEEYQQYNLSVAQTSVYWIGYCLIAIECYEGIRYGGSHPGDASVQSVYIAAQISAHYIANCGVDKIMRHIGAHEQIENGQVENQ